MDCETIGFTDSLSALNWCLTNQPDLLVVDEWMPHLSGQEVVSRFRACYPDIPVLMVVEYAKSESRFQALQIGVTDFLNKPLDHIELIARTKILLALRKSQIELTKRTNWLIEEVNEAYQALERNADQEREIIDIVQSNLKLEEANRTKNDFLARVSHDLRTPLTTILGYSDMLTRDTRLAQHHGEFSVIRRNARHLLSLIDELLEFARNRIGPNQIKPVPLYLHSLIDEIKQQAEALAQESGNRAVLEMHGNLPRIVILDPVVIRRVLFNLLSNAAKFTRQGTLMLRVVAETTESPENQALTFEVSDTGVGIDPADQLRIFEPFYRAASVTRNVPGSGLGLAICRQWVQAMGSNINVSSVPGQGSKFSFRVICLLASETDIDISDTVLSTSIDGLGHSILVVEDNADIRHYLTDLLNGAGFRVMPAAHGREALELAEQHKEPPSAVITDQSMPEMDGWSLLAALRPKYGLSLPVILLSATPAQPPEGWPSQVRFDANLLKPLDSGRLFGTLAQLLKFPSQQLAIPSRPDLAVAADRSSAEEFQLPHVALLNQFQTWAEQGALSTLETQAAELISEFPEYAAFAAFVLARAEALDIEGIAAFCLDAREKQVPET
ncbi:MAG: response regulator [Nitrosomonadales bacterium]